MKEERPRLNIPLTASDRWLERLSIVGLLAFWGFAVYMYPRLPEIIPVHFNIKGEIDDYGNKITWLLLPVVATLLYLLLTMFSRYPHLLNYPVKITAANAERYYAKGVRLLRILKLAIVIILFTIAWIIIQSAI